MSDGKSWTRAYWDTIDQLYWYPKYLGMGSISQSKWTREKDLICIPKHLTNKSGPLYRRVISSNDIEGFLKAQEETFNHVLDIALAIIPPNEVGKLVSQFVATAISDNFHSIGRNLLSRFKLISGSNITQPDCYLLGDNALTCLELKFDSPTSLDQLAKYMWLCLKEEETTGRKRHLNLVYIAPGEAREKTEIQLGFPLNKLSEQDISKFVSPKTNKTISKAFADQFEQLNDIASRLVITAISWNDFKAALEARISSLVAGNSDQTLVRLYEGLISEICSHPLSQIRQPVEST